jgi:hypothetical protein
MVNPFKHVVSVASSMFASADQCDYFDHTTLKVGAVVVMPIVAPIAFVAALFKPSEGR